MTARRRRGWCRSVGRVGRTQHQRLRAVPPSMLAGFTPTRVPVDSMEQGRFVLGVRHVCIQLAQLLVQALDLHRTQHPLVSSIAPWADWWARPPSPPRAPLGRGSRGVSCDTDRTDRIGGWCRAGCRGRCRYKPHCTRARIRPCGRYISKRSREAASLHIRSSCSTGTDRTLRYGHRLMPFARQIVLSDVRSMPRCFATAFSGILKYLDSSCIESSMTCVGMGPCCVVTRVRAALSSRACPPAARTDNLGWQGHRGGGWSAAAQDRSVSVTYVNNAPGCLRPSVLAAHK